MVESGSQAPAWEPTISEKLQLRVNQFAVNGKPELPMQVRSQACAWERGKKHPAHCGSDAFKQRTKNMEVTDSGWWIVKRQTAEP